MNELEVSLQSQLESAPQDVEYGISIADEAGGSVFEHNAHTEFQAASIGKLAIAAVAGQKIEQEPDWQDKLLRVSEDVRRGGTGILQHLPDDFEVPTRDTLHWMLAESDNTAAKMIVRDLGGPEMVNNTLREAMPELATSGLLLKDDGGFEYGYTTAHETVQLFDHVLKRFQFRASLHQNHCDYMLRRNIDVAREPLGGTPLHEQLANAEDKVSRQMIVAARRPAAQFPNKEGTLEDKEEKEGLRHDVTRIGRFTVAVLSRSELIPTWKKAFNRSLVYEDHPSLRVHGAMGRILMKVPHNAA